MANDRRDCLPSFPDKEAEALTCERIDSPLDHTANRAGTTGLPDQCFYSLLQCA